MQYPCLLQGVQGYFFSGKAQKARIKRGGRLKINKDKVETSARFKIQYPMKNRIEYCK